MFQRLFILPLFAAIMGFALGGSVFWGLFGPNTMIEHIGQAAGERHAGPKSKKDATDEALAYYTLWLTIFTGVLALATIGLGVATIFLYFTGEKQVQIARLAGLRQFRQTRDSIKIAHNSAESAERSLVAANRPWIKIDMRVAGPIHYDANGANFPLIYVLENVGNSPAININIHPRVTESTSRVRTELLKSIETWREFSLPIPIGFTLFPGEKVEQRINVCMSHDQIKEATKLLPAIYPTIIGSAVYKIGLDDAWHQTGFVVDIRRRDQPRQFTTERNYAQSVIWIEEGDVPAEEVRLFRSILSGGYAD